MKILLIVMMLFIVSCNEATVEKVSTQDIATESKEGLPEELEDCDDKVEEQKKKAVESALNLEGGDEGCTLDETH